MSGKVWTADEIAADIVKESKYKAPEDLGVETILARRNVELLALVAELQAEGEIEVNIVRRQTLVNLTENLMEALTAHSPEEDEVLREFDKLQEHIDRYIPRKEAQLSGGEE